MSWQAACLVYLGLLLLVCVTLVIIDIVQTRRRWKAITQVHDYSVGRDAYRDVKGVTK